MQLLGKLKRKKETPRTVLSVSGHPASLVNETAKEAYLTCVCVISYADEVLSSAEQQTIRDLANSLEFSSDKLHSIFEFASNPSKEILDEKVTIVAEFNLALPCLADMALIAYADGQFCEETEAHYLNSFAQEWSIEGVSLSRVLSLARAVYGGRIDQAENELNKKWAADSPSLDAIRTWVSALKASCAPTNPGEEKRSIAMAVPVEGKTDQKKEKQPSPKPTKINADVEKIDSFKVEVISQLGKLKQLLEKSTTGDEPLAQPDDFKTISLDLQSELAKVEDLRMTLAFVGTMKAGKSTTINAVVGANVLPNRSGAMTTLPTLITHIQGNTTPCLSFSKKKPFDKAIGEIQKYCKKNEIKQARQGDLYKKTLDKILSKELTSLETNYNGQKAIYSFMESMNDIARICADFELESPLSSYTSIEDFPEIEVEFAYLADREGSCAGKLSLVDTPGPNEAGQSGLKGVVKEQLAKASAIVCVAEPTQVDSEAQAEIRDWIQGAQKTSGAPLFVLLNKIDTMPCEERNAEIFEARALRLFPDFESSEGDSISIRGKVYGISSHQALLANMASHSLRSQGRLPNWTNDMWVKDFLEKGGLFQDDPAPLEDTEWIATHSLRLWNGSMMQKPMEKIILQSMHQAVPLCLGHALEFVGRNSREIQNTANVRLGALGIETKQLEEMIQSLKASKDKIDSLKKEMEGTKEKVLGECAKKLDAALTGTSKEVMAALKKEGEKSQKKVSITNLLWGEDDIEFDDRKEAQGKINFVAKKASKLARKTIDKSISEHESFIEEKRNALSLDVEIKMQTILCEINKLLNENFNFRISSQKFSKVKINLDLDISANQIVKTEEYKSYYTERNPWTLWLTERKVWFTAKRHTIKPKDVRKTLEKALAKVSERSLKLLQISIGDQFSGDLNLCLKTADETIGRVQNSIEQARSAKGQTEEKQEAIRGQCISLADNSKKLGLRSGKIKASLNSISEGTNDPRD